MGDADVQRSVVSRRHSLPVGMSPLQAIRAMKIVAERYYVVYDRV